MITTFNLITSDAGQAFQRNEPTVTLTINATVPDVSLAAYEEYEEAALALGENIGRAIHGILSNEAKKQAIES